ncbi:DUF3871 family protein [Mesonia sp. K7]|uniref:DUF3871 family protein n=1 Tax=Mesonia sp. K7 TaxID=2218606 RepID=UPI000DA97078|nr:DUF3871 family protein [Mesonia sp. K7]PZD78529.1 hypothetical protein DNG35_05565 [Mesonia sp. K7]
MEAQLIPVRRNKPSENSTTIIENKSVADRSNISNPKYERKPFIEANTSEVSLSHLKSDCIIPVFSKDNERTIAHTEFIEIAQECANKVFPHHHFTTPEIRVSHQIKGRVPSAIHKTAKELLDHEKTIYYERMAFMVQIPSITETINGNEVALTFGGVRAYNQENLYSRKTFEKFKFFIGFQNLVCCNMCVSSDGFAGELKVDGYETLRLKMNQILKSYHPENHIQSMQYLSEYFLSEHQFAQLIGRARLYNYLSKKEKKHIPELQLNDGQISTVARDYYQDESFCRNDNGDINLWSVYNLFTQANKSSYIDTFLERNVNAFDFSNSLVKALNGSENYHWFLS